MRSTTRRSRRCRRRRRWTRRCCSSPASRRTRRERRTTCPQRARQYSISHQWHHAPRRRRSLRADPRHRHRRQPGAPDPRALPAKLASVRQACWTFRPGRTPSTTPAKSASMAAATERLRRLSNMAARSGRRSISRPGAFSRTICNRKSHALEQRHSRPHVAGKRISYLSTVLDPTSRLTFISGVSNAT